MNFTQAEALLRQGIAEGLMPGAAYAVGQGERVFAQGIFGNRQTLPESLPLEEDTLFDLASLSKLVGTSMAALRSIESGRLLLSDPISRWFPDMPADKSGITLRHLLTHTSGIPAHLPLWQMGIRPEEYPSAILSAPLRNPPGRETEYSCMGFLLLGRILELVWEQPLDELVSTLVFDPLGMASACYCPDSLNCAATEYRDPAHPELGILCGEVHDENARFVGGAAGNAGIFCRFSDMVRFASMLSGRGKGFLSERMFRLAVQNATPGCLESRGLGFQLFTGADCPCGDLFSPGSFGHTGFTGTSLYVDEKTGVYILLLTNRVHPSRENGGEFFRMRRAFQNAVWGGLSLEEGGRA